jgi:hypothetical protein
VGLCLYSEEVDLHIKKEIVILETNHAKVRKISVALKKN